MVEKYSDSSKAYRAQIVAEKYFINRQTMTSIGQEMGISRSTISRLIDYAYKHNIISISINNSAFSLDNLEKKISTHYNIDCHVVAGSSSLPQKLRLDAVGMHAARILSNKFDSNKSIGVAWGATVSSVAHNLPQKIRHNTMVVQLNGAANSYTTGIGYAADILYRFRAAWGSEILHFPVPAFFDKAETKNLLWQEKSIQRILNAQSNVDIALFSVGSPKAAVSSHVYSGGYLSEQDIKILREHKAVGDISTVFFRKDASWQDIPLNLRSSSPGLDVISKIPVRFCVSSDPDKTQGIIALLEAKLITDLVIDAESASYIANNINNTKA